jgi:sec-independent protein translocase protein TatC
LADGPGQEELQRMSLLEHLDELRGRILWSLVTVVVAFLVCFAFAKQIFHVLSLPINPYLPDGKLSFITVTEPFFVYVKSALVAAVFLTSPFLLFQAWRYVSPGLYKREKRWALPFIFFGSLFFAGGGAFGYFVAFPFAAKFLVGMGSEFNANITISSYFNILINILLGLGVMFEMPIVIFVLSAIGVVTPQFLLKNFRWAVLIIFVIAAIITPTPDVFNLCIVALPTIVLYLLGVGAAWLAFRKRRRRLAQEEQPQPG